MQKPITAARTSLNAVIVTLDNHLSGAIGRVATALAREIPGLQLHGSCGIELGIAALLTGGLPTGYRQGRHHHCQHAVPRRAYPGRDAGSSGTAGKLRRHGRLHVSRRGHQLTKLGRFKMDGTQGSLVEPAEELAGQQVLRRDVQNATAGAQQLAMLKRIPKILRFIPGSAQDVRAYFLSCNTGWQDPKRTSAISCASSHRAIADGPRKALCAKLRYDAPKSYPEVGVYHPRLPGRMSRDGGQPPGSAVGAQGHRRSAADALLRALGRHRALRRRDRSVRVARAEGHSGLCDGPGPASGHREASS